MSAAAARKPRPAPRPRRGAPEDTRRRLVAAAAEVFNREGYEGTDSNRLARAAGYAPGTFYKHFRDKREIFLAVYAEWVDREWEDVSAALDLSGGAAVRAARIVDLLLTHHRRWSGLRASLRMLTVADPAVREFYRGQRRRQFTLLQRLRVTAGDPPCTREQDALLLFTLERTADAMAEDEAEALGLDAAAMRGLLVELVAGRLRPM
ncbi:TetR/AcrR family transcriptional regulator [Solimonas sp. K1W22B-7]|uniref:TetR/AcrR family transcriptional regulator n=1 Tax=Solimonas sp. K1W22B-7 TaxID=2303331 RepID=UPI000E332ABF|nr:TetR/AcrR family transcriptional regulator [Solimonas sp. K1W22B-7]AXQ30164.1 TetR/AcrR family transcriptional regulator [Solimonas sp. K1W22B-7]